MYERFTDRARKVMRLTQEAAQEFNHNYVGTEDILLGLIREGSGVAANLLRRVGEGVSEQKVLAAMQTGTVVTSAERPTWFSRAGALARLLLRSSVSAPRHRPFDPQAKHVIESAMDEARQLGHDYIGTEHILLGLLRETDSVAAKLLMGIATLEAFRKEALDLIASPVAGGPNQGFLGLQPEDYVEAGLAGVRIASVQPDTPAARAGLAAGEIILRIDDVEIHTSAELVKVIRSRKPGDKVILKLLDSATGNHHEIVVTLDEY